MDRHRPARRLVSVVIAAVMMLPALALAAQGATATWLAPEPDRQITTRKVEVSVGYNTQSSLKVTRLELWIDGRYNQTRSLVRPESRGVCSFWWDTAKFPRGSHDLSVKIYAGDELVATVSGTGTIGETSYDLRAPSAHFANVKTGDVLKGAAAIKMAVSDDGAEPPIVSLLVDNTLKYLTNRKPYVYSLDTTKYPDGEHELQTLAYDSSGNKSDPVVVKVTFKNDLEKPVAAAMDVETRSPRVAPSEDDGVGKLLPPAVEPGAQRTGAARASEPEVHSSKPAVAAHPVARKPEAKPSPSARPQPAPLAVQKKTGAAEPKRAAARPEPKPAAVPSVPKPIPAEPSGAQVGAAVPSPKPAVGQTEPRSSVTATEPVVALVVPPAEIRPKESAAAAAPSTSPLPAQPALKEVDSSAQPRQIASGAEPRTVTKKSTRAALAPPTVGKPKPVAVATAPSTRAAGSGSVASAPKAGVVPRAWGSPVRSSPRRADVPGPAPRLRDSRVAINTTPGEPQAPQLLVGGARAATPKPVRVAMLPTVRGGDHSSSAHSGIVCPPPVREDRNAKIEKRLLQAKGKIKLRDLVNELGGVVFWDGATKTATAYLHGLKMEVRIGSSVVRVNGKEMRTELIPRIARGRTIIDGRLYAQACAFVERGAESASAGVH